MTRQINAAIADKIKGFEGLRLYAYPDPASDLAKATPEFAFKWGWEPATALMRTLDPARAALSGTPWTIGYGHTGADVTPAAQWDKAHADAAFLQDIEPAERIVSENVTVDLSDTQFGALVSFAYNVGYGAKGVKDGFVILRNGKQSTLLRLVNSGNKADIPHEMLKWANANGQPNAGLKNRRNAEGGMWVGGAYVAGNNVQPDAPTPFIKTKVGQALSTAAGSVTLGSMATGVSQLHDSVKAWGLPLWGLSLLGAGAVGIFIFRAVSNQNPSSS